MIKKISFMTKSQGFLSNKLINHIKIKLKKKTFRQNDKTLNSDLNFFFLLITKHLN